MAVEPKLRALVTNSDDSAELPAVGVTCIVGSNNVGKSQLLRDIVSLLENRNISPVVLSQIIVERQKPNPTLEDVTTWLKSSAERTPQVTGDVYGAIGGGQNLTAEQFRNAVQQNPNFFGPARAFYCWYADAGSRVGLGAGSIGSPNMGPNAHPLARLYREGDLEERLSALSKDTFDFPLTLDRVNGNVRLLVGEPSIPPPLINRPTREYADAVASLLTLESQGDGVKSFIGLALHAMAGNQPIMVIDEPEAFLHQAQAKALGRWIAEEARSRNRQAIVATHSRDIILGLLAGGADVTVLRLTRDGDDSHIRQLPSADLISVWDDPILRYSNVLDGLFYKAVVVCEADADCRFYGAVLDYLATSGAIALNPDDVLFVPSGGKDRVPNIARSLGALGVDTFAIVDFDVLKDRGKAKNIVESLGGSWTELDEFYNSLKDALNAKGGAGWEQVKTQGLAAVPAGAPSQAAASLLDGLRRQRLLVVPVGELEGFDKTISGKSSMWVNAMLAKNGHQTCAAAKDLIRQVRG